MVTLKIRQLPPGAVLDGAGIEIGQGDLPGTSRTVPARTAEIIARSFVLSRSTLAPPADNQEGDRYYVPDNATGAWAGRDRQIAEWLFLPNNIGASTASWYFSEALGVNLIEDEGIIVGFGTGGTIVPVVPLASTVVVNDNYEIETGVGFVMVDLGQGSVAITLPSLSADAYVGVKDYLKLANPDDNLKITAVGTLDGEVNPDLVFIAGGWSWLKYTHAIDTWSLMG